MSLPLSFKDTASTDIYTLSLHDALPISNSMTACASVRDTTKPLEQWRAIWPRRPFTCCGAKRRTGRSEEHTSELQSRQYLVCRLLLEKKKYSVSTRYYDPLIGTGIDGLI